MRETLASIALLFATHGFPVGPCCRPTANGCSYAKHAKDAPCKFPGKAPIPYRGVRGYTTDPATIQQFFRWYPTANLGIAMGQVSGHFVIESDGPQGEAFLQSFHVPPTPTVISARGPHRYLLIPPGYAVKTTHFGELDIMGDGDQVIGPGSRHVTGHVYHWHDYLSLKEVEPIYPPERLLSWLTERGALQRVRSGATQTSRRRPMNTPKVTSRALSQGSDRARGTSGTEHRVPAETAGGVIRLASTPIQDLLHPTRPMRNTRA